MAGAGIVIDNLTVVIPTFNRLDFLKRILDTIPRTIQVIVSDNGSSVPKEFMLLYPEVTFFQTKEVLRASENWNNCINLVQTEWFTLPSDDDLYYTDSFEIISRELANHRDCDLLVFGHNVIDEEDKIISTWIPKAKYNIEPPFSYTLFKYGVEARFPGLLFKKALVVKNDGLDNTYKLTASDSKLIQLCMLSGVVSFVPAIIGAYRVWSNNSTSLTLGTVEWLNEIDRWQDEILIEAEKKFTVKGIQIDAKNIKDEVFALNLIGGILNLRKRKGVFAAFKFVISNRFPSNANLKTRLLVIKAILIG